MSRKGPKEGPAPQVVRDVCEAAHIEVIGCPMPVRVGVGGRQHALQDHQCDSEHTLAGQLGTQPIGTIRGLGRWLLPALSLRLLAVFFVISSPSNWGEHGRSKGRATQASD